MDAAKMKEILKKQFGINNEDEFNAAVEGYTGINLGLFTTPIEERRIIGEQNSEAVA